MPTTSTPLPVGVPGNWTLRFDDEFNAGVLDQATWEPNFLAWSGSLITPGDNADDIDCLDPAQVFESGGTLHLAAAARPCAAVTGASYQYATGLVNTKGMYEFTYGYMEARIDLPATSAGTPANFPAFWAMGDGPWPASGEIDVMEILRECGEEPGFHLHNALGTFGGCAELPQPGGWHTFGADWQPGQVTFYYDGARVGQVRTGVTSVPEYLLLDNSIDPTLGGPTLAPADLQVDYVRVWQ